MAKVKSRYILYIILTFGAYSFPSYSDIDVSTYPLIEVHKSNINVFSTPIAYYHDSLFTVNVEAPEFGVSNGINLRTTIREASLSSEPQLTKWKSYIVDNMTLEDKYHTQASIAVDKSGYLHIAYNMHNMPWQYAVSKKPGDISGFSFHGEAISAFEKFVVKHLNKTTFPGPGTSDIQGTQITYPAFFYDNNNDIYITYRFAAKPKRAFKNRAFSGGIAKYDLVGKKWHSLGGTIPLNREDADWEKNDFPHAYKALAYEDGWTVYLPRLAFDSNNGMHVSWFWREGTAGPDTTRPTYAYKPAGAVDFFTSKNIKYVTPVTAATSDWIGKPTGDKFLAISHIEVTNSFVYVILQKYRKNREIYELNRKTSKWRNLGSSPYGASIIKIDANGGQWAFATGLTVLFRNNATSSWKVVYSDKDKQKFGYPKVLYAPESKSFFIHTQSISEEWVKIYKLDY